MSIAAMQWLMGLRRWCWIRSLTDVRMTRSLLWQGISHICAGRCCHCWGAISMLLQLVAMICSGCGSLRLVG